MAPSSFVSPDGRALPQLAFTEVSSQAQGVAFCTAQQAMPFLANYKALSVDPLALAITSELPVEACSGAPLTNMRFPAVYEPTGEPIALLQLGDEVVQLKAADIAELDTLDTSVVRLALFRDETALDWQELCKAPIRLLLQHIPGLVLCKDPACAQDCGRFHAAVDDGAIDRLMLDVWGRVFARTEGGKAPPERAGLFQCLLRVLASATMHLQKLAVPGLYVEPRSSAGLGPHEKYSIVWLPSATTAVTQHTLRTCSKAISIARIGRKFGIRVRSWRVDRAAHLPGTCGANSTFEELDQMPAC